MTLTIFDYLVLLVVGCSSILGSFRGLVKECFGLFGWFLALFIAKLFTVPLASMLPPYLGEGYGQMAMAFVVIVLSVKLLLWLVGSAVMEIVKSTGLQPVDRTLGAFFGFARGVLIVVGGVIACGTTAIPYQPEWREAVLMPLAVDAAKEVLPFLPEIVRSRVQL